MFELKNLKEHFEPSLTFIGAVLGLGIAAYIFSGIFLLGVGRYWLGTLLLVPIVIATATLAYRESSASISKFPRLGKALGILHAVVVIAVLVYVGVQLYGLSKV